jgi:hypothetical protein
MSRKLDNIGSPAPPSNWRRDGRLYRRHDQFQFAIRQHDPKSCWSIASVAP